MMPERSNYQYSAVGDAELNKPVAIADVPRKRAKLLGKCAMVAGWVVTTSLLVAILWKLSHLPQMRESNMSSSSTQDAPSPYASEWTNCGSSPAEARKRGCKFDILSFAWQLPQCYDEKIMEDFMAEKDWEFFKFPNKTSPVSRETALTGEYSLFVTMEYHRVHCMYMWQQMHRAFTVQKYIDSHLNDWHHTLHCNTVMLGEQLPLQSIGAAGVLKYPDCSPVL